MTIRIAVIGCGLIGQEHLKAVEQASAEFAGTQTNRDLTLRFRTPEAIVPMILFSLSKDSDMMTGRLLRASSVDDVQYLLL